jgi:hypothetical protein
MTEIKKLIAYGRKLLKPFTERMSLVKRSANGVLYSGVCHSDIHTVKED